MAMMGVSTIAIQRSQFVFLTKEELERELESIQPAESLHIVRIDGSDIQSWHDFINRIQAEFRFPTQCYDNMDGYLDWIRDLSWLEKDGYVLIIDNFSEFLKSDCSLRDKVVLRIVLTIMPFWHREVELVVVEGHRKPFMVYAVD